MSALTKFLGTTLRVVLAVILSLLPALAFSLENISSSSAFHESARGNTRISDPNGRLSYQERLELEGHLDGFWKKTGQTIRILIGSSSNSMESLQSYSERVARAWGMDGKPGQPGGILLVIDPQTKRAALSVPSDLKMDFQSGSIHRIINDSVEPVLMKGELAKGIAEGIDRVAEDMVQHNRINRSLFVRGYGILASVGIFITGMMLRRRWGVIRSAVAASLTFGAVVCLDLFNAGFPWYEVLSCAILSAPFLGLFVWVGMGNDIQENSVKM